MSIQTSKNQQYKCETIANDCAGAKLLSDRAKFLFAQKPYYMQCPTQKVEVSDGETLQ